MDLDALVVKVIAEKTGFPATVHERAPEFARGEPRATG